VAFGNDSPLAGRIGDKVGRMLDDSGRQPFAIIDGIALISIEGTLVHKGAYVGPYSGRTSYEGLQAQVLRAMRNPAVKGVVFEVDSFGGELAGASVHGQEIACHRCSLPVRRRCSIGRASNWESLLR
jgi:ClpP class serine protease